jgi:hypothetical protein
MNGIKNIKDLVSEEKQFEVISLILKEHYNNKNLANAITKKFREKNINVRLMSSLFGGEKKWQNLTDYEKVAFVDGCHEGMPDMEILDINKWFSDEVLVKYDSKIREVKEVNSIFLKDFRKINDYNYLGYAQLEDIYNWFNNTLLIYNYEAQREPTYKTLGTGEKKIIYETYTINDKAKMEIAKSIIDGTYEEDMLIYNVLIQDNPKNILQVKEFEKYNSKTIYDVEIIPNYDRLSNNYTVVNPLDGWHRTVAGVLAYEEAYKMGKKLDDRGFPLKLTIRDLQGSKNVVNQIFKRTDTSQDWLDQLDNNDYNLFVEALIEQSEVLREKVSKTYEQYLVNEGNITYSAILSETIEKMCTNIQVNNRLNRRTVAGKMAMVIDDLFEAFLMKRGTMHNLINNTHLADVNIFIGYLAIANILSELKNYDNELLEIANKIMELTNEELLPLKLINKGVSIKNVYNFFERIVKEVVNHEN